MSKGGVMINNISYIICFAVILFSIITSMKISFEDGNIKETVNKIFYYLSVFLSFFIIMINFEKIYLIAISFINKNSLGTSLNENLIKIITLFISFLCIQTLLFLVFKVVNSIFSRPYNKRRISKISIFILSSIFGFLKGCVVLLMIFLVIGSYNTTLGKSKRVEIFNNLNGYNSIERIIKNNKPVLSYEEFKDYLPNNANIIIYYNGVTLDEGIKSSEDIDKKALEITKGISHDKEKAKKIYAWVGSNISYDYDKAEKALSSDGISNSGAIEAFTTRKGICFDYACLYIAMLRANDISVRLITGDAFDGTNFGPHAWNEVYLEDEDRWIKVDPTFYMAGDYFDNSGFDKDHVNSEIAGEW